MSHAAAVPTRTGLGLSGTAMLLTAPALFASNMVAARWAHDASLPPVFLAFGRWLLALLILLPLAAPALRAHRRALWRGLPALLPLAVLGMGVAPHPGGLAGSADLAQAAVRAAGGRFGPGAGRRAGGAVARRSPGADPVGVRPGRPVGAAGRHGVGVLYRLAETPDPARRTGQRPAGHDDAGRRLGVGAVCRHRSRGRRHAAVDGPAPGGRAAVPGGGAQPGRLLRVWPADQPGRSRHGGAVHVPGAGVCRIAGVALAGRDAATVSRLRLRDDFDGREDGVFADAGGGSHRGRPGRNPSAGSQRPAPWAAMTSCATWRGASA
ncbi:hypothetical protein G6F22_014343 [Rhizopus arrhizus]|nr:hypothetical protein G6F22_014343 [Rhizopus arrhizus]